MWLDRISRFDRSRLHAVYQQWPDFAREGLSLEIRPTITLSERPSAVVYVGMGGSACPGDVINDWLGRTLFRPLYVLKSSELPSVLPPNTLIMAVSYSGDTEETVLAMKSAIARGLHAVGISSGGELERVCRDTGVPHIKLPTGLVPRAALPYMLYPSIRVLEECLRLREHRSDVESSIVAMREAAEQCRLDRGDDSDPSKKLASFLQGGLPVIHSSYHISSVSLRFKNSLNENAKVPAICEELPELSHNSVNYWVRQTPIPLRPVFVRISDEPASLNVRFEAVRDIMKSFGIAPLEFSPVGGNLLSQLVSSVLVLDMASIYLAVLYGVDPAPTPNIESIKFRLRTGSAT